MLIVGRLHESADCREGVSEDVVHDLVERPFQGSQQFALNGYVPCQELEKLIDHIVLLTRCRETSDRNMVNSIQGRIESLGLNEVRPAGVYEEAIEVREFWQLELEGNAIPFPILNDEGKYRKD